MPNFTLVIKAASIPDAEMYARNRRFTVVRVHAEMPDVQNVTLVARGATEDAARWFAADMATAEQAFQHKGPGFPMGSLLIYREQEEDAAAPRNLSRRRGRDDSFDTRDFR